MLIMCIIVNFTIIHIISITGVDSDGKKSVVLFGSEALAKQVHL